MRVGTEEVTPIHNREVEFAIVIEVGGGHAGWIRAYRIIDRRFETERPRRTLVEED